MEAERKANYLVVFIILAAATLIETLVSYMQQAAIKFPVLIALSLIKVVLVLLFFMHLKYDAKVYRYLFIAGCVLVIPLILIIVIVMPLLV